MSDLAELAARCESTVGPDRGLDAEIAAAVRHLPSGVGFVWRSSLTPNMPEVGRIECCTSLGTGGPHYKAPTYTTSLDAAMMLVPEGWAATAVRYTNGSGKAIIWRDSFNDNHTATAGVDAATPALALCAAALKARDNA